MNVGSCNLKHKRLGLAKLEKINNEVLVTEGTSQSPAKMLQHINHKVAQKMAEQLTKSKVAQKRKK